jgi:hypothetical protein
MALNQLGLYNDALLILGQRQLASLSEDREPRHRLDSAYGVDAIRYCLELVKPNFATRTSILNSPAAATTFAYSHTFPSNYVTVVKPYTTAALDQPVTRYIIEGKTLKTDFATVYLRYVADDYAITDWDPSFFRVVAAYLAKECATRLSPEEYEKVAGIFTTRVKEALDLESLKAPRDLSKSPASTLTNAWRAIYNDALLIMGLDEIAGNNDDSNRRVKLSRALDAGIVADLMEDMGWQFGQKSAELTYNSAIEPSFGYTRAIAKPLDMHRIDGIYLDEYMHTPLAHYADENGYFYCDYDVVYLSYVSTDFLATPSSWPTYFKRLVAARMAKDAAPSLRNEGADPDRADAEYIDRRKNARSTDAMVSPPRLIQEGSWVKSRHRGDNRRGRP